MPTVELLQECVEKKQDFRQFVFQLLREPGNFKYFDEKTKEGIYMINFADAVVQSLFPKFKEQMTVVCSLKSNTLRFKKVI